MKDNKKKSEQSLYDKWIVKLIKIFKTIKTHIIIYKNIKEKLIISENLYEKKITSAVISVVNSYRKKKLKKKQQNRISHYNYFSDKKRKGILNTFRDLV